MSLGNQSEGGANLRKTGNVVVRAEGCGVTPKLKQGGWWEESGANVSGSARGRAAIRRKLSSVSAAACRTTCFIKSFVGKVRTGND